jgi:hypothetical protein
VTSWTLVLGTASWWQRSQLCGLDGLLRGGLDHGRDQLVAHGAPFSYDKTLQVRSSLSPAGARLVAIGLATTTTVARKNAAAVTFIPRAIVINTVFCCGVTRLADKMMPLCQISHAFPSHAGTYELLSSSWRAIVHY